MPVLARSGAIANRASARTGK